MQIDFKSGKYLKQLIKIGFDKEPSHFGIIGTTNSITFVSTTYCSSATAFIDVNPNQIENIINERLEPRSYLGTINNVNLLRSAQIYYNYTSELFIYLIIYFKNQF